MAELRHENAFIPIRLTLFWISVTMLRFFSDILNKTIWSSIIGMRILTTSNHRGSSYSDQTIRAWSNIIQNIVTKTFPHSLFCNLLSAIGYLTWHNLGFDLCTLGFDLCTLHWRHQQHQRRKGVVVLVAAVRGDLWPVVAAGVMTWPRLPRVTSVF